MLGKTKVSVTVQTDLLEAVDRLAGDASRSTVFEKALVFWVRQRRRADLDRAIEEYYLSLEKSERAEDERWARLGDEATTQIWDEPKR